MTVQIQPSLADRTLGLANRVAAGEGSAEELAGLLAQLLKAAKNAHRDFGDSSRDNPELSAEAAVAIAGAMERYCTALADMQKHLQANQLEGLAASTSQADEARTFVRNAETQFRRYLEQGDTVHVYLNRVLLHINYFAAGGNEARHTLAMREALPLCIEEIRGTVGTIDDPAVQHEGDAALDEILARCEAFFDAVRTDFKGVADRTAFLKNLSEEMVAASDRMALALASQMQQDLAVGRTPLAPVNIVLALADRIVAGACTPEQYLDGLLVATRMLDQQVPGHADEALLDCVDQVKGQIDKMRAFALNPDPDLVAAESAALTTAGENLALFAAVLASDEEYLLDVVSGEGLGRGGAASRGRGLPRMLVLLLHLGEAFVEGQVTREQLEQGINALEELITSTESQASAAATVRHGEQVQQSLSHLRAASEAMWMVADTTEREHLDRAEEAMVLANMALRSVISR